MCIESDLPVQTKNICYKCDTPITTKVEFIEWIPLFLRYVCVCNACHIKYDYGEFIPVIKQYEKYLAGKCTQLGYMKVYYRYHPKDLQKFLEGIPNNSVREYFEGYFNG